MTSQTSLVDLTTNGFPDPAMHALAEVSFLEAARDQSQTPSEYSQMDCYVSEAMIEWRYWEDDYNRGLDDDVRPCI